MKKHVLFTLPCTLAALLLFYSCNQPVTYDSWAVTGGSKAAIRYSSLTQIDTNNVQNLQVAWQYHTGDADTVNHSQIQCNPIIVDGILYGTSPKLKLFAIDAGTGKEKWVFNPADKHQNKSVSDFIMNNNRGVTYWSEGDDKRILYAAGSQLLCVNAADGKLIESFGNNGSVDLHQDLGKDVKNLFVSATSPGIIYKDLLIIGSRVSEGSDAAPGHIRAYDVRTGKLRWIFHTIPYPGEPGYDSWEDKEAYKHIGGANCWSGFSLDEKRGIVFAPIGSASFDFYGGKRRGYNLYADCLLALDAATGKLIWHFQDIHHDIWDKDLPTAPALITITRNGRQVDAVAQPTKTGFLFVLDRETGQSLFPVTEQQVPTVTELEGEKVWPTQPMPLMPKPFVRQTFNEGDINPFLSDSSHYDVKRRLASYKTGDMFTPPSKQGTVIFPGFDGGAEWGGPAFDPATGVIYINANEMPWVLTMVDIKNETPGKETYLQAGKRLYQQNCMTCHGPERKGGGNYPSLVEANKKYNDTAFHHLLSTGRRMMPAFKQLSEDEKNALASFILNNQAAQKKVYIAPAKPKDEYLDLPYTTTGYNKFLTKEGWPAIMPPWGTLNAIDLNTGQILWKKALGEYPELKARGLPPTGTENYGGPVVTAGGVVFIAAARDGMLRAFNKRTGQMLLERPLPAPGFATPSVYNVSGKQYLVIACGGGKLGTKSSDSYVAFALNGK